MSCPVLCTAPASLHKSGAQASLLTVHLCGFSPVCLLMWTTSIYWALKGFCSREQSSHRHTNSFFSPCMWSLLICCSGRARGYSLIETQHQLQPYCNFALEEHQRYRCEPGPCDTERIRPSALSSDHGVQIIDPTRSPLRPINFFY